VLSYIASGTRNWARECSLFKTNAISKTFDEDVRALLLAWWQHFNLLRLIQQTVFIIDLSDVAIGAHYIQLLLAIRVVVTDAN